VSILELQKASIYIILNVDADDCFPSRVSFDPSVVGVGKRCIGNCSLQATVIHCVLHVPLLSNEYEASLVAR
jgi:hypothetical protein